MSSSVANNQMIRTDGATVTHNRCGVAAPNCTVSGDDCIILNDDCIVSGKRARIAPQVRRVIVAPGGTCVGAQLEEKCTYVQSDGTIVEPRAPSSWQTFSARTRQAHHAPPPSPAPAPAPAAEPTSGVFIHSRAPAKAARDGHACMICEENAIDVVFDPCRHAAFCGPCARRALALAPACPVCSTKVASTAVIFLL